MKKRKYKSLERRIAERVRRKRADVFLRKDFADLGNYDQVGRALGKLVAKQELMKIGYGLYARTKESSLYGDKRPAKALPDLAREALDRLDVETRPSSAQTAYNENRSTQVPTGRVIGVRGRVSRKIGYNGAYVTLERVA